MKQQGRRCLAYFSGGKTFRKRAKKAKNATNHCFYNAKRQKKQNAYAKKCGKKKQKGRRCLAYFSGGKTFRKNVKKAKNVTNHCFYNAKNAKKTKRIREKMRKKGKDKGRRCLAYFSGGKTFGKKAKRATNATNHCFYNAKM